MQVLASFRSMWLKGNTDLMQEFMHSHSLGRNFHVCLRNRPRFPPEIEVPNLIISIIVDEVHNQLQKAKVKVKIYRNIDLTL